MQLIRYVGWTPKNRPKKKPVDKSARRAVIAPRELPVAAPVREHMENADQIPSMTPLLKKILFEVCCKHGVTPNDVTGPDRAMALVRARKEFVIRCRAETMAAFTRIGRAIRRDHTTVIYYVYGKKRGSKS